MKIVGEHPLSRDPQGDLRCRIGTIFPSRDIIVTLPGIHATQRLALIDMVNEQRRAAGQPPLTEVEQLAEFARSVDLIMEDDAILIRPDPDDMEQAFAADELLQDLVPKHKIRFLHVRDPRVRDAVKRRGECWRIAPLPKSADDMRRMIRNSRIGISGREMYYYNKTTGARILTYEEMSKLAELDDERLGHYLSEIREYSSGRSRAGGAEIAFFKADGRFGPGALSGYDFASMSGSELRTTFGQILARYHDAVGDDHRRDSLDNIEWKNGMFAALIAEKDEEVSEEVLLGLGSEFYMQIEWLPGARIDQGELIFDPLFEQTATPELCDEKARGFILNFVREYGDLEYVNMGRVIGSLSRRAPAPGRRAVYIAEIKLRGSSGEILRIIRMQKWGVQEHLDSGKSLLEAIVASEEYTEYIMDRRLGCRQLGMNLPSRIAARKIGEVYHGSARPYVGVEIWSTYFERDYIRGVATDKVPRVRFEDPEFARRFAVLLGQAASPNMIVGRADGENKVTFDDGDEVLIEDATGLPHEIIVADHTGAFTNYLCDLRDMVSHYADPLRQRRWAVPDYAEFVSLYVKAFTEQFAHTRQEYRRRRRAFDTLFRHVRRDEGGSFAFRWEQVLRRLDRSDPMELGEMIRRHALAEDVEGGAARQHP